MYLADVHGCERSAGGSSVHWPVRRWEGAADGGDGRADKDWPIGTVGASHGA